MIRLHNVTRPPGPVEVVGPTPETVRQVRIARQKRGFVGARAKNHRGRATALVLPAYPIDVPDAWRDAPDVLRKVRARKIRIEDLAEPAPVAASKPSQPAETRSRKRR